jgi:hypothetical protein
MRPQRHRSHDAGNRLSLRGTRLLRSGVRLGAAVRSFHGRPAIVIAGLTASHLLSFRGHGFARTHRQRCGEDAKDSYDGDDTPHAGTHHVNDASKSNPYARISCALSCAFPSRAVSLRRDRGNEQNWQKLEETSRAWQEPETRSADSLPPSHVQSRQGGSRCLRRLTAFC